MKKIKYYLIALSGLISACSSNSAEKEKEQLLYDEVIAIHDEVMPEMSTIMSLQRQLKVQKEVLDSASSEDMEKMKSLDEQIRELEEADEAMMQWMRNFEANHEGWSHDSIMSYLSSEKKSISKVRDEMNAAIDGAEKLLGN